MMTDSEDVTQISMHSFSVILSVITHQGFLRKFCHIMSVQILFGFNFPDNCKKYIKGDSCVV